MKKINLKALTAAFVFMPQLAFAHVGEHELVNSFSQGFLHPILGIDHLIMLLAMGVVAQHTITKKSKLSIFVAVIATMMAGVLFGKLTGAMHGMEALILGSVFVVAGTVWKLCDGSTGSSKVLLSLSIALVLFHGWAHGAELNGASLIQFIPGMLLSSLMIMGAGYQSSQYIPSRVIALFVASSGFFLTVLG